MAETASTGQARRRRALAVGVTVTRRIGVDDVDGAAVEGDRIRVRVEVEERSDLLHALLDVTHEQDARILLDRIGDQRVDVLEPQRERGPPEVRADPHTGVTGEAGVWLEADLLLLRLHDRIAGQLLRVVQPGGLVVELDVDLGAHRHRQATDHERRFLVDDLVGGGHRHAVAVRIDEALRLPRLLGQVVAVQLPGAHHDLGLLAVDLVAVDVELVLEAEPAEVGLAPAERVVDDVGVEQADVAQRRAGLGRGQRVGRDRVVGGEVPVDDVADRVGVPGSRDVARDVRPLPAGLGRLDPEALDEPRIGRTGDDRHQRPQPDGQDRQDPPSAPDVEEEQPAAEQRDEQQQHDGGQLRLHVRVAGPSDEGPIRHGQLVALQPVPECLDEGEDTEQHRQVRLHLGRHPLAGRLQTDPTVEVVRHGGDDQDDHERREQPADQEAQERQLEDVETDVLVEQGVTLVEVDAVGEEQPIVPLL